MCCMFPLSGTFIQRGELAPLTEQTQAGLQPRPAGRGKGTDPQAHEAPPHCLAGLPTACPLAACAALLSVRLHPPTRVQPEPGLSMKPCHPPGWLWVWQHTHARAHVTHMHMCTLHTHAHRLMCTHRCACTQRHTCSQEHNSAHSSAPVFTQATHMHTFACTCTRVHMAHVCTRAHTITHKCVCTCSHKGTQTHIHICM